LLVEAAEFFFFCSKLNLQSLHVFLNNTFSDVVAGHSLNLTKNKKQEHYFPKSQEESGLKTQSASASSEGLLKVFLVKGE